MCNTCTSNRNRVITEFIGKANTKTLWNVSTNTCIPKRAKGALGYHHSNSCSSEDNSSKMAIAWNFMFEACPPPVPLLGYGDSKEIQNFIENTCNIDICPPLDLLVLGVRRSRDISSYLLNWIQFSFNLLVLTSAANSEVTKLRERSFSLHTVWCLTRDWLGDRRSARRHSHCLLSSFFPVKLPIGSMSNESCVVSSDRDRLSGHKHSEQIGPFSLFLNISQYYKVKILFSITLYIG